MADGIREDASLRQREERIPYSASPRAESISSFLFLCPQCRRIGTLRGKGKDVVCCCGLRVSLSPCLPPSPDAAFPDLLSWDLWQVEEFRRLAYSDPSFTLEDTVVVLLWEIDTESRAKLASQGFIAMSLRKPLRSTAAHPQSQRTTSLKSGAIFTWMFLRGACARSYPAYFREGFISMYDMLTETIGSGILLLRDIDPGLETPAANNLVIGSSYGIVLGAPMLIFVSLAARSTIMCLITFALICVYAVALCLLIQKTDKAKESSHAHR